MSGIRMIVNAAEKGRRRILSNVLHQKMSPARVLLEKVRNIMDKPRNQNERTLRRLFLDCKGVGIP
jgi:hypothetical protein